MSVERINELNVAVGVMFGKKMEEVFGTEKERPFMTAALDRGEEVVARLLKLVEDGITFDLWREYFLDVNSSIGAAVFFNEEEKAQLDAYCAELREMDLLEYYNVVVKPYINLEQLKQDVVAMKDHRAVMEEVMDEKEVAPDAPSV